MDADKIIYGTRRLLTIHLINILINILGAATTFVWFSLIQPGLAGGGNLMTLRDRAIFVIVLVVIHLGLSRSLWNKLVRGTRGILPIY